MKDKLGSPISVKLSRNNVHLTIFGFDHRMEYDKCPKEYMDWLKEANILLQEGEHGIIGVEPLSHKEECVRNDEDTWYEQLDEEKQDLVQKIVNEYCANVLCDAGTPSASSLSFSAICQIVGNFDYWYNTIHPKIDKLFRTQGKTIVDLDVIGIPLEDCNSRTLELFVQELEKAQVLLKQNCGTVSLELEEYSAVKATRNDIGKLRNEEKEFWLNKDSDEYNSMVINRNQKWCELLDKIITQHSDGEAVEIVLVCGK
ncbi:MAG: hypothetical protein PV337_00545 [Rickettsiaceae bacterium]|nr:hypothetical protein [Rickettsiaceae bacterium]